MNSDSNIEAWVVEDVVDYEGSRILGIFSSPEKAQEFAEQYLNLEFKYIDDKYKANGKKGIWNEEKNCLQYMDDGYICISRYVIDQPEESEI